MWRKCIHSTLVIFGSFVLLSCAEDIKGEQGETGAPGRDGQDGQDASAVAVVALRRPGFESTPADPKKIIVPASENNPAQVFINNLVYTNTVPQALSTTTFGRNGLETLPSPELTPVYLYAIPKTENLEFDLIASIQSPNTGPDGFANWSYLGAFLLDENQDVLPFVCSANRLLFTTAEGGPQLFANGTATSFASVPLPTPSTVKIVILKSLIEMNSGVGSGFVIWSLDGSSLFQDHFAANLSHSSAHQKMIEIPLPDNSKTIWYRWGSSIPPNWNAGARLIGWMEDPTEWK